MPTIPPFVVEENKKQSVLPSLQLDGDNQPLIPSLEETVGKSLTEKQKQLLEAQVKLGTGEEVVVVDDADSVRNQASEKDLNERKVTTYQELQQTLQNADATSDIVAGAILKHQDQVSRYNALETKAVEAVVGGPKTHQRTSAIEKVIKDASHDLLVQNLIQEYETEEANENLFEETLDFFKTFFTDPIERGLVDVADSGDKVRLMLSQIKEAPDADKGQLVKELKEYLEDNEILGHNPQNIADMLRSANWSDKEKLTTNVFDFLDVAGIGQLAKPVTKGLGRLAKIPLTRSKAPNELINAAKEAGNQEAIVKEILEGEVTKNTLYRDGVEQVESALRWNSDDEVVTFGRFTDEEIANRQVIDKALDDVFDASSDSEFVQEQLTRYAEERGIKPDNLVDKIRPNFDDKSFSVVLGDGKGRGFITSEAAKQYADEVLGLTKYQIKEAGDGSFKVNAKLSDERVTFGDMKRVIPGLRWLDNIDEQIQNGVLFSYREAEGFVSMASKTIQDAWRAANKGMTKKDWVIWDEVAEQGVEAKKWLTPEEFKMKVDGRADAKKLWVAYDNYRKVNDFTYLLAQQVKHRIKKADGLFTYRAPVLKGVNETFEAKPAELQNIITGDFVSKPVTILDDASGARLLENLPRLEMEKLLETHNLVKLDNDASELISSVAKTKPTRYGLVPKTSQPNELRTIFTSYSAGGRRYQDSPYFIKVAQVGDDWRGKDLALYAADTLKEGKQFVDDLNKSLEELAKVQRKELAPETAQDWLSKRASLAKVEIHTLDDLAKLAEKKNLIKNGKVSPIQVVRDREAVALGETGYDVDLTDSFSVSSQGNPLTSARAEERLMNIRGEAGDILNPVAALNKNLENVSRMAAFEPFKARTLEYFVSTFGKNIPSLKNKSLFDILRLDSLGSGSSQLDLTFKTHQQFVKDMLVYEPPASRAWKEKLESAMVSALDNRPVSILENGSEILAKKLRKSLGLTQGKGVNIKKGVSTFLDNDPAAQIKGVMFTSKLGLNNPASFVLQAMQGIHIAGMTKHGWSGATRSFLGLRGLFLGEDALKAVAAKGNKLGFESADDYIESIKEFKRAGFDNIGNNIALVDGAIGFSLGNGGLDFINRNKNFTFELGELSSRMTAYQTARLKWLKEADINPKGLSATSKEGREFITNETHRLMQGMTRADVQFGMRGIAGIPFQFASYPLRATSIFFGKQFSNKEKGRLLLTYLGLYGTMGIPVLGGLTDSFKRTYGDDISPDTMKAITNGLIDSMVKQTLGADTDFARRAGLGMFAKDIVDNAVEGNIFLTLGGPAGQTSVKLLDTIADSYQFNRVTSDPVTSASLAAIEGVVNEISTASLLYKTWVGYHTERLVSMRNPDKTYGKINKTESVLMMLGLPPSAYEDVSRIYTDSKIRKEVVKETAKRVARLHFKRNELLEEGKIEEAKMFDEVIATELTAAHEGGLYQEVMKMYRQETSARDNYTRSVNWAIKKNGLYESDAAIAPDVVAKELQKRREKE